MMCLHAYYHYMEKKVQTLLKSRPWSLADILWMFYNDFWILSKIVDNCASGLQLTSVQQKMLTMAEIRASEQAF